MTRILQRYVVAAVLFAGLVLAFAFFVPTGSPVGPPKPRSVVTVTRVVDGDTIVVDSTEPITGRPTETIRLIGVDTPETKDPRLPRDPVTHKLIPQCYGPEASAHVAELLRPGITVTLAFDAGTSAAQLRDRTPSHRLLAYVWLNDGTMLNLDLVRDGYARARPVAPQDDYRGLFKTAEATAKAQHKGRWGACATTPASS
jgi:micrococcal nuclease